MCRWAAGPKALQWALHFARVLPCAVSAVLSATACPGESGDCLKSLSHTGCHMQ